MFKVTVVGHYGGGFNYNDGQTIKTKNITNELIKRYGRISINTIDSHGRLKSLIKAPIVIKKAVKNSANVIMLPAHRGLKVYGPLMVIYKQYYKSCNIIYIVVGGWLPNYLERNWFLRKCLKKFDKIFVETNTMKSAMNTLGFENVDILPNFKSYDTYYSNNKPHSEPFHLCTFSRVLKEKGIGDAVAVVNRINKEHGRIVYKLDIYGPIDPTEKDWFEEVKKQFGEAIQYKGSASPERCRDILKQYFALLFPTHFYTEGIPGTIIDSFASGVPVVSSKWESFDDVVDEGITGYGYTFASEEGLYNTLCNISQNPELIESLRTNCIKKYTTCYSEKAVSILFDILR